MATFSASGFLYPAAPFDFEQSLDFIEMFPPMTGEQTTTAHRLVKTVSVACRPLLFNLNSVGTVEAPKLAYELFSDEPLDEEICRQAEDRMAFFLSLNDDLHPFYQLGQADPFFTQVIRRRYGHHQVKFLTPFENAVWAILVQRQFMNLARRQKEGLAAQYGRALELNGVKHWAFPEPAQLAAATYTDLLALLKNERRASYLSAVIQAFNQVDEAWLRTGDYQQVSDWLLSIPGIGAWSARFILIRGLGRMEGVSGARGGRLDEELVKAIARVYGPLSETEMQELAGRYGPWQGYWAYYLRSNPV